MKKSIKEATWTTGKLLVFKFSFGVSQQHPDWLEEQLSTDKKF